MSNNGSKLGNLAYLYLHLDRSLISVMGLPWENKEVVTEIPRLVASLVALLENGVAVRSWQAVKDYGYRQRYIITYNSGRIAIRFDRKFKLVDDPSKKAKKYILVQIRLTSTNKLDYSAHHSACLLVDSLLEQSTRTRDFHLREIEIAGDTLDAEHGRLMAMSMVPQRANLTGWELKKRYKQKQYLHWADGQYFHCRKEPRQRNRQWHCYVKGCGGVSLWRIEFRCNWKYLKPKGVFKHQQLIDQMEALYHQNIRFMQPDWGKLRKAYIKFRDHGKYPLFTRKAWGRYLEWQEYSVCGLMTDLQSRLDTDISRYFIAQAFPMLTTEGHKGYDTKMTSVTQ